MKREIKPPDISGHKLARHVLTFGRVLRHAGLEVGTEQILDALRALDLIGLHSKEDLYSAFYSIFVTRYEHVELFDQAFHLFWRAPHRLPEIMKIIFSQLHWPQTSSDKSQTSLRVQQALAKEMNTEKPALRHRPKDEEREELDVVFTYSPLEVLRKKDFSSFTAEEILEAKKLLAEMRWPISPQSTRRRVPDDRGRLLDLRRSVRKALRHQGEMVMLSWNERGVRSRRIIVLCDISGSMERYVRMLLHFMHAITAGMRQVETFVFGTRLTRITRYLRLRDIDEAIRSISTIVNDWSGGTKIGECLKEFNFNWARRVLRSGAVVMIISDGWDRGDIPLLKREIERLSKSCYRLIWLNPLLGYEDYEPLTQGMQTALPYIDHFLPIHNLESLDQLGKVLESIMD